MIQEVFSGLGKLGDGGGCTCRCWCPLVFDRVDDTAELQMDVYVDEM